MDTPSPDTPSPDAPHGSGEGAPISRIVSEVARACPGERITLGQMSEAFGDRAFGLLVLLLCLPALLPGAAMVFGLPLLLLGVQMGLGRQQPALPRFMARQSIRRADLLRLAEGSSRWLGRVERYVRPRPGPFTGAAGDRLVGWLTVWTAVMLILPGPGTNGPPAFGNIVMALGVVEHDNRVVGWGAALTAGGCLVATGMLLALCWMGWQGLSWLL
ncbi:exopolysaccharide biosynthesis protein [Roseomonas elaeocarpi]|uniref:Exopolysaccharide biosynthesis protein n=1 Tax=Roseomonas elaeocarpi TaxID=907779 RepID=A0ABV6JSM4_9PROT